MMLDKDGNIMEDADMAESVAESSGIIMRGDGTVVM